MEGKKTDRRVKYTKMVIKDSFVKFLKQKPISKISVKEICEDADINRATFYSHYTDQYDLLQQIESDITHDIIQYLEGYDFVDYTGIPVEMIERILKYVEDNSELFDLLLNLNGDIKFQQEVIHIIGRQFFITKFVNDSIKEEDAEYIYHFLACGAVGLIQIWLRDGMKKPVKDMAELILKASLSGSSSFIQSML